MSSNTKSSLAIFGITLSLIFLIIWVSWMDRNGIRVYTGEPRPREIKATGRSYNIPIEIRGYVEYDGDRIVSKDTIVEFCDVKLERKHMKQEMKAIWTEMRKGCK